MLRHIEALSQQVPQRCLGCIEPAGLTLVVNKGGKVTPQDGVLLQRQVRLESEAEQEALNAVCQPTTHSSNLLAVLLYFKAHGNDLVVSVAEEEVQIVEWRGILVFEPVEQLLLNHSKLHRPLFKLFS